jgi:UDP-N-acetylglucosamine/UDP-N-acetylgalactosamine diphosphorylase
MTYESTRQLLDKHNQSHVLRFWDRLDQDQQQRLLSQVSSLDFAAIGRMREMLAEEDDSLPASAIAPAPVITLADQADPDAREAGEAALRAGEVAALIVAGGQGSRLGFDGPKGAYPIAPVSDAPLFAVHARKILALSQKYGAPVPFYIMTSQANDAPTREFFRQHGFFGLPEDQVHFFPQGMWPGLWRDGRLAMDQVDQIFMSPDGHGGVLSALKDNGMIEDMKRRGIATVFFFQVDNPLVEVADPGFIGLHRNHNADISIKVCAKRDAAEGLGVVVERGGAYAIVEYTELTDEQKNETGPDGRLRFLYGSVAIHVFSLDFLEPEANTDLPLHIANKKIPYCDDDGNTVNPTEPNGCKFEKFIFDVIPDAARAINVEFAREDEFSPVKNATGNDSPATTKRDMTRKFARWLEACGVAVPRDGQGEPAVAIEIDPCYALGPDDLRDKLEPGFTINGDTILE